MDIVRLNMQDELVAGSVWRLQHKAYAIEAQLIGFAQLPPLMETIASLQQCEQDFYGVVADEELQAVISIEEYDQTVTVCRLMVEPEHHRKGLGRQLLRYVEQLYPVAKLFLVSTGSLNEPALRLYQSMGYKPRRQWEAAPGLMLTDLAKRAERDRSATD